jgi:hypothetical protein
MFTDPIAQAIITNPGTGRTWDWTAPKMPFLTGLTLMWEMERTGVISMTIDTPYDDGIAQILTPPTPFAVGNFIKARIGYASGQFTDWAIGILNAGGDGLSIDPNGVSGTVNFEGVSRSAHYTVSKDIMRVKDYKQVLEFCARGMGVKLEVSPEAETKLGEMSKLPVSKTAFCSLSAFEVVQKVCKLGNLTWTAGPHPYQMGKGVRWLTISTPRESKKIVPGDEINNYVMRGIIDVANRQYPLFSWSPEGAGFATWLAEHPNPAAAGIESIYCNTESGVVEAIEVLPSQLKSTITGVWPESPPEDLSVEGIEADNARADEKAGEIAGQPVKPGSDGQEDARKQAEGAVISGSRAQVGVVSTIGVPDERCEKFCNVFGLGPVYDGYYLIRKINHIFSAGTYDMSLTVQRMGTGGQEKADGAQIETAGGQEA